MDAILITRCGCRKEIQVPEPPPRELHIPLTRSPRWSAGPIEAERWPKRTFELDSFSFGSDARATYIEKENDDAK